MAEREVKAMESPSGHGQHIKQIILPVALPLEPSSPRGEQGQAQQANPIPSKISLIELRTKTDNLKARLEGARRFVSEQEEELADLDQTIAELETKIKTAGQQDYLNLQIALVNAREQREMLEATLVGQRRNLRQQEATYQQHRQVLAQRETTIEKKEQPHPFPRNDLVPTGIETDSPVKIPNRQLSAKQWLVAGGAVGLLLTGTTVFYGLKFTSQPPSPSPAPGPTEVATTPGVSALGYLEPAGEKIELSAPAASSGVRLSKLLVKRGDWVKKGQIVAILDSQERLQAALEQAKTQVRIAQARLAQVQAGAKPGDIQAQDARFQEAQAELEGQIAAQKVAIAGLEAQLQGEQKAQSATVERIKAQLKNAEQECQRYLQLYQEGGVSVQERDRFCLQQKTSYEQLREAEAKRYSTVSTLQKQIAEAGANLDRTVATLQRQIEANRATLNSVAQVRPADVQVARAELQSAKAAVQLAEADLALAYIRSPRDGQILKIQTWPGEIVKEKGIVELGQTEQMYVTAEVYETDVSRIRQGQRARISSSGITKELQGTVAEIGLEVGTKDVLGTDPVADADARVVEVKIRLDAEDSRRVAGLTNLQVNVIIEPNS